MGFFVLAMFGSQAFALTAAYVSFDHPEGWKCDLISGVWMCQSTQELDRKESIVLSIATKASEFDSLENYESYLKQPRTVQDDEGNSLTSKITYTRRRNVNGFEWVDSLQQNSELAGFWARYLATVITTKQNKYAILITYIVSEDRYSSLAPLFERMIATLKPNTDFDMNVASSQGDGPLPGSEKLGASQSDLLRDRLNIKKKSSQPPVPRPSNELLIIISAAVVILLLLMRIRRKRRR